jgi:ArsR family transcriptional regulator
VSRNLAILKRAGLVTDRRLGVWIHYSLSPNLSDLASDLLQCITQRCQGGQFAEDDKRLALSRPRTEKSSAPLETPTGDPL